MRVKFWLIILTIFFLSPQMVLAISPTNKKMIKDAQEYGIKSVSKPASEFFKPWLSYEEEADIINETTEYAYFYTPFLLVASDAREKSLAKKPVELSDGEALLKNYAGYFVFSVNLKGDEPGFANRAKAVLRQEKISVGTYQTMTDPTKKSDSNSLKPLYSTNFYFYFKNEKFSLEKPIFLNITLSNKEERRFYFDLTKLK